MNGTILLLNRRLYHNQVSRFTKIIRHSLVGIERRGRPSIWWNRESGLLLGTRSRLLSNTSSRVHHHYTMASSTKNGGEEAVGGQKRPVRGKDGLIEIREGSAVLRVGDDVFYNNVQNVNRDFSVLALNVFAEQWNKETEAKNTWRKEGIAGWRKSTLTWDWWGAPTPPPAKQNKKPAAAASSSSTTAKATTNEEQTEPHADEDEREDEEKGKAMEQQQAETADDGTFRILEALSASGLRSIRYAKEVVPTMKKKVVANDREVAAVESIRRHTLENGPYQSGTVVETSHADAVDYMHARRKETSEKFHIIDLDPYGAPSEFLDSAVQCIENGGMMCVTATDTAVLCGSNMDKCRPKYGGLALHRPYSHEMAIRMVLACIDAHANRHGRFIVPLLSLKLDFYIRVFVRVHSDHANEVKRSSLRHCNVLQSKSTDTFRLLPLVVEEGNRCVPGRLDAKLFEEDVQSGAIGGWMLGGPMWSAPIHNYAFIETCLAKLRSMKRDSPYMKLKYVERLEGTLAAAKEELPDVPLYYSTASLCKTLHCSSPPLEKFQAALMNGGFRVSQSHHNAGVVKTDAPPDVVWDILRCWIEKHPINKKRMEEKDSVVAKLLAVPPKFKANYDSPRALREARHARKGNQQQQADANADKAAAPKWHQNPEKYWGPKSRADNPKKRVAPLGADDATKRHDAGSEKKN